MITPIPVFAGGLRRRRLRAEDGVVDAATLFPMFGSDGTVHHVMVVDEQSSDIRFLDPRQVAVRVPIWGAMRLECELGCLARPDDQLLAVVGRLWHFDPWWMLAEPRYGDSKVTDILKATNCVGRVVVARPHSGLRQKTAKGDLASRAKAGATPDGAIHARRAAGGLPHTPREKGPVGLRRRMTPEPVLAQHVCSWIRKNSVARVENPSEFLRIQLRRKTPRGRRLVGPLKK